MQLPLQVSFRHMVQSPALESLIRERAARLDTFAERIMSCRVVIEPVGKHHRYGNQYAVRIDIKVPGGELVSTREPSKHKEYKEIAITIRDAFDAATRQLEDYVQRQRGDVKSRAVHQHACINKLVPAEDYGFLLTPEGREIFFHRNSVLNEAFDRLQLGTEVAFEEKDGDRGPQASSVTLVGRHGGH